MKAKIQKSQTGQTASKKKSRLIDQQLANIEAQRNYIIKELGVSNFGYNTFFFECGLALLDRLYADGSEPFVAMSISPKFWCWYKIEWYVTGQNFIYKHGNCFDEYEMEYRRCCYNKFMIERCVYGVQIYKDLCKL